MVAMSMRERSVVTLRWLDSQKSALRLQRYSLTSHSTPSARSMPMKGARPVSIRKIGTKMRPPTPTQSMSRRSGLLAAPGASSCLGISSSPLR